MAALDFKEIPEAHKGDGLQDTFELFARDFLTFMGYNVVVDPARGADGGADLVVEERRTGIGGETIIRWLVSCKHKAHSGASVSPADDSNLRDRVEAKGCQGFIGFYSTLASSGLCSALEGMKGKFEYQIFDREKIESNLLHSAKGLEIAERFFPKSIEDWRTENPQPADIFRKKPSLKCRVCAKELLDQDDKGVITIWKKIRGDRAKEPERVEHIFWTCRGRCDQVLAHHIRSKKLRLIDGWEDISDVMMPTIFIKWVMSIMNEQREGVQYSDEAFGAIKDFLLQVYPHVSRHPTSKEVERVKSLSTVPAYLGGLGYEG